MTPWCVRHLLLGQSTNIETRAGETASASQRVMDSHALGATHGTLWSQLRINEIRRLEFGTTQPTSAPLHGGTVPPGSSMVVRRQRRLPTYTHPALAKVSVRTLFYTRCSALKFQRPAITPIANVFPNPPVLSPAETAL